MKPFTLAQLRTHLQKEPLALLYLIHSDELLLVQEAEEAIRSVALKAGCTEASVLTVEAGFDWTRLAEESQCGSLFGDKKRLEIRIPSGKPGTEGAQALIQLSDNPPDGVTLLRLPRLDKTAQSSKWFAACASRGVVVALPTLDRVGLHQWLAHRLETKKFQPTQEALAYLVDRTEGNLLAAHQEVEKLALCLPSGELTLAILQTHIAQVARYDAFDLPVAFLAGDVPRLLRILEGLEAEGEAPTLALWSLVDTLRQLWRFGRGLQQGKRADQLCRELRIWGEKQRWMESALKQLSARRVRDCLRQAAQTDAIVKGLKPGQPWAAVKQLALMGASARVSQWYAPRF